MLRPTWHQDTWWQPFIHILYNLHETKTLGDTRISTDVSTYLTPIHLMTTDSAHTLRPTWHQDTCWQPTLHILYDLPDTNTLGDNRLSTLFTTYFAPYTWWQPTLHRLYDQPDATIGDNRLSTHFTTNLKPGHLTTADSPQTLRPTWHLETWRHPAVHIRLSCSWSEDRWYSAQIVRSNICTNFGRELKP